MDPETDLRETASLRYLAQACLKYLRQLSQDEEKERDNSVTVNAFWATRQLAEFNLWCANVGVHVEGLRSLDVRLKDVPEISKILLQLLRSLHRDLEDLTQPQPKGDVKYLDVGQGNDDGSESDGSLTFVSLSSSEVSDSSAINVPTRMDELRQHISDTLDRLHGQARRIERAGAHHRRKRIEVYRQKERPIQVFQGYKELGFWKAKEQFNSATECFQQRIGESFARRRIRFEYLKEHQKKRAIDMMVVTKLASTREVTVDTDNDEDLVKEEDKAPIKLPNPSIRIEQDQRTLLSATIATKYDALPGPKQQEKAESVRSIAIRHPGFPPRPQIHDGKFQCPYCLLEFRDREAEKERWSQHVMQDFEPYFCTFEDCTAPFDVPNSFDGLLAHMQSHLPARHHVDNSTVGHKELTEEDFEDHVRSYGVVTKENMISMKEASRRKGAFLFETCPFCGGYPDVLEKIFPDRDSFDAQRGLRGHIKQHMQEIALFLPPYRSDIFDEDDNCEGSDVTHRRSNIDEADYNPDQFLEICDREDCDCKQRSEKVNEDSDIARAYEKGVLALEAKKVDWANVLEGFSGYDRAKVSDGDLLTDDRLCPFIMRFALQEPHDDIGSETWGTVDQRVNDMLRLLRASFRERITMEPSQLDDVTAIHFLLVNHKSQFLEDELALWQNSKNGNLAAVRRLLEGFKIPQSTADVHSDTNVKIAPLQASETVEIQENEESKGKDVYELNINELQGLGGSEDWRGPDRAGRSEAFYKNVTVWIEWKQEALAPWMNGSLDPRIHKQIRDLVVTLQEFRVSFKGQAVVIPRYIGYFQDVEERQFGLVLEKPLSPVPMEEIASLHELLVSTDTNKPDMDKRIHLIRNLQSAIKYIHAEGHVHRGLRSQNILLFRSERSTSIDLTRSYLAGFDVLYPELSDDCTELPMDDPCVNIYRHPRSQAGGNRDTHGEQFTLNKSYDLYSLGLVLLEIAHWNTIDRIMEIDLERGRPKDTLRVRERLLTGDKTSALAWVANVFHVDAAHMIRACLEGEDIVWGKNTTSAPQMPDIPYIPPPIPEMPRSPSLASALSSDPSHDDSIISMESGEPVAHWAMNIFDGRHTSSPYHSFSQSTTQPIPSSQTPPVSTNSQSVSKSPLPSETPPSPSLGAANPVSETTSAQESSSSVVHPSDIHDNSSICLGRDEPRLIELLQNDGFEKVVDIPFEATNVWVRLYWRANDNRARIVFLTKDSAGRRMRYCVPLTGLKVMRDESCLQLCRVNRKDGQLDLWARLRFVTHERMVLFYCTAVAMKRQDEVGVADGLEDFFDPGERLDFSAEISDSKYLFVFRVFRDEDSGCVRFEVTARRGPLKSVPVWTAFVTQYMGRRSSIKRISAATIQFRELHPYVFREGYQLPKGPTGKYQVTFTAQEDARLFINTFHQIRS